MGEHARHCDTQREKGKENPTAQGRLEKKKETKENTSLEDTTQPV